MSEQTKLKKFHVEVNFFDGSSTQTVLEAETEEVLMKNTLSEWLDDAISYVDTVRVMELIELTDDTIL